jgi:hypothetical protein
MYGDTAIGKRDIHNLKDLQFLKSQWDTRLGDGASAVMKLGDGKEHATSDPDGVEEPWEKRVKAVMDKLGCSKDAAISHLHRPEKVSKGM